MRNTFINQLVSRASVQDNIYLVVGDLGYSVVEPFADLFPNRFINSGVAEQNMMGLAAGLASEGNHVFVYSIANFPTFRCAEQLRNDVDYQQLSVTTVAVGGGLSYGPLGYSHHAIQDYALLRTMPNMLICSPSDPCEVSACLDFLFKSPSPSYLRLNKAGEPILHDSSLSIAPGIWLLLRSAQKPTEPFNQKCILTTGNTGQLAIELQKHPVLCDFSVYTLPVWGMPVKHLQAAQVSKFAEIITLEDHLVDAGFGSWLKESISPQQLSQIRVISFGLSEDVCGLVGSQDSLNAKGNLCLNYIVNAYLEGKN